MIARHARATSEMVDLGFTCSHIMDVGSPEGRAASVSVEKLRRAAARQIRRRWDGYDTAIKRRSRTDLPLSWRTVSDRILPGVARPCISDM